MKKKKYPIDWMPPGSKGVISRKKLKNVAIMAGKYEILLKYKSGENPKWKLAPLRKVLRSLTLKVMYTDIYNQEQPMHIREFKDDFR